METITEGEKRFKLTPKQEAVLGMGAIAAGSTLSFSTVTVEATRHMFKNESVMDAIANSSTDAKWLVAIGSGAVVAGMGSWLFALCHWNDKPKA